MKISVVIPVYGCRAALPELHRRLGETLVKLTDDYEIILVNDNCPQNSWEVIEQLCRTDPHVKGIELSRNFGQMKAILAGLDYSTGDWVVVMDCDLQDRPEEIIRLYEKAQEGYDAVFAKRRDRKDSAVKAFFAKGFYRIYRYATDGNYDGSLCNFSIVSRKVVDSYCRMREEHRAYVIYMRWLGFRQTSIEVDRDERYEGESSYSFKKRMNMALELLTSQSDKILRLTVGIGAVMVLASAVFLIYLLIHKLLHPDVAAGWTSIIASEFLIGGVIIMVVGIVGVYVGNIFVQTKQRPLYVVRQILNDKEEEQ